MTRFKSFDAASIHAFCFAEFIYMGMPIIIRMLAKYIKKLYITTRIDKDSLPYSQC